MAIRNDNIELAYQSLFIPSTSFSSMGLVDGTPSIASAATGNSVLASVGSTFTAFKIGSATDEIAHLMAMPSFIDTNEPVYVRCHWTSASSTTADTLTPTVTYRQIADGGDIASASSGTGYTGDKALDIVIPADNVTGAGDLQVTQAGTINSSSLDDEQYDAIEFILRFAFAAGLTEDKFFLGLELFYLPKLTPGAQKAKVAVPNKLSVAEPA